jgi:hypothetical protein
MGPAMAIQGIEIRLQLRAPRPLPCLSDNGTEDQQRDLGLVPGKWYLAMEPRILEPQAGATQERRFASSGQTTRATALSHRSTTERKWYREAGSEPA